MAADRGETDQMPVLNDLDDLKGAVGTEIGVSDWQQVTQQQIDRLADATGDD